MIDKTPSLTLTGRKGCEMPRGGFTRDDMQAIDAPDFILTGSTGFNIIGDRAFNDEVRYVFNKATQRGDDHIRERSKA